MFGNDVFGMCRTENEGKEVFELSTNLFLGANQTKHNSSALIMGCEGENGAEMGQK